MKCEETSRQRKPKTRIYIGFHGLHARDCKAHLFTVFTHLSVCCPCEGSISRNNKVWADAKLTQRWKDVARHFIVSYDFVTLSQCWVYVITTLLNVTSQHCHNIVNWHRWNFHFQRTTNPDTTISPRCDNVFVFAGILYDIPWVAFLLMI